MRAVYNAKRESKPNNFSTCMFVFVCVCALHHIRKMCIDIGSHNMVFEPCVSLSYVKLVTLESYTIVL